MTMLLLYNQHGKYVPKHPIMFHCTIITLSPPPIHATVDTPLIFSLLLGTITSEINHVGCAIQIMYPTHFSILISLPMQLLKYRQPRTAPHELQIRLPPHHGILRNPRLVHSQRTDPLSLVSKTHGDAIVRTKRVRRHLARVDRAVDVLLPAMPVQFVLDPALRSMSVLRYAVQHPFHVAEAQAAVQVLAVVHVFVRTRIGCRRVVLEPSHHAADASHEGCTLPYQFLRGEGTA
mmetsp:Transcript_59192/g.71248  ORF Transcript_59192/g.71248 Transcript_59192/m.71248 type:complete len:234 (+) Transcript_59192:17-718(+)